MERQLWKLLVGHKFSAGQSDPYPWAGGKFSDHSEAQNYLLFKSGWVRSTEFRCWLVSPHLYSFSGPKNGYVVHISGCAYLLACAIHLFVYHWARIQYTLCLSAADLFLSSVSISHLHSIPGHYGSTQCIGVTTVAEWFCSVVPNTDMTLQPIWQRIKGAVPDNALYHSKGAGDPEVNHRAR